MRNINLPIPPELLDAIDQQRGDVPRTVWIRRAIEQRLRPRSPEDVWHWLYERAEDAASGGLSLDDAREAVRCGYSSIEADRDVRADP